jgi:hypothetical protein
MRKLPFILFSIFVAACLFSCKPSGSKILIVNNAKQLIVGNWNLQQTKLTQYVNGVKQVDTLVNASEYLVGFAQFNQTGSYLSVSASLPTSTNIFGSFVARDSTAGTYTISNNSFYLSPPYLAAFPIRTNIIPNGTGTLVITDVSHTAQLIQLTSKLLTIHIEIVSNYTYSSTGVTTNYKTEADMYYSR